MSDNSPPLPRRERSLRNMNPDVQARVLAFQARRQQLAGGSQGSPRSQAALDSPESLQMSPLEGFEDLEDAVSALGTPASQPLLFTPTMSPSASLPVSPAGSPSSLDSDEGLLRRTSFRLPETGLRPVATTSNLPKRSLSERRGGVRLNLSELKLPSEPPRNYSHSAGLRTITPIRHSHSHSHGHGHGMDRARQSALPRRGPQQTEPAVVGSAFTPFAKYVDIKSGSLNFAGKASVHSNGIDFSNGSSFRISMDDLVVLEELGRGNYGVVSKVLHKPTGVIMAMKEVRLELDDNKLSQILMELEVLHNCDSSCIVDFYGAFFVEGAVYMCIECMQGGSLDRIYGDGIPEFELRYITKQVVLGLKQLKDQHNIIHRDVKPTNILVSTEGTIKLCDFGVSGNLVASLAKTNIGCQSYMAPERINVGADVQSYSVQSDVWSLGLSILEIGMGGYPYPSETYTDIFSQLTAIVDGPPPELPRRFSAAGRSFVSKCLRKNPDERPTYSELLQDCWLRDVDDELGRKKMVELVKRRQKGRKEGPVPALHHPRRE